jgi:hypothetical protein
LVFKNSEILLVDSLLGMYHITPYTYKKAKTLGVSVKPSTNTSKKIDVFKKGKKVASVGGAGLRGLSHLSAELWEKLCQQETSIVQAEA